jgi:ankyrin repeat protein
MNYYINVFLLIALTYSGALFCMKRSLEDQSGSNNKRLKMSESLYEAASFGDVSLVQAYINSNTCVDTPIYYGKTPLHSAIFNNHKEVVMLLLNAGADPNHTDNSKTPILHSLLLAQRPYFMMMTLLLRAGYNLTAKDYYKKTILHWAATCRHSYSLCKVLVRHGADPRAQDIRLKTPGDLCFANIKAGEYLRSAVRALEEYIAKPCSNSKWSLSHQAMLAIVYNGETPYHDFFALLMHYAQNNKIAEMKKLLTNNYLYRKIFRSAKRYGFPATQQMLESSASLLKAQEEGAFADVQFLF